MIEVLLSWVVRVVFVIIVVRFVMRAFGGAVRRPAGRRRPGPGPQQPLERAGGNLVQDPQCGTYIPMSRAIRLGLGEHAQYFCSTSCRDQYTAAQSSVAS